MSRKYCLNCKQFIKPKKNFHGVLFTLLMIFVWLPTVSCLGFMAIITAITTTSYTSYFNSVLVSSSPIAGALVLLVIMVFLLPFVYVVYYIKSPAHCPICNDTNFRKETFEEEKK